MKQINNGFEECYYLTREGKVYNNETNKYLKEDNKHRYRLKRKEGSFKSVSIKSLYKAVYNKVYVIDKIEDIEGEKWQEISGTDGIYYVSTEGRVKSYANYEAIILKPTYLKSGYGRVDVILNGRRTTKLIHRLVACAFLPLPTDINMQLHHINNDKKDNRLVNLVWMTQEEHIKIHMEQRSKKNGEQLQC